MQRSRLAHRVIGGLLLMVAMTGLVACGDDDDDTTADSESSGTEATGEAKAFLDVVKASIKAENAKDVDAFLALWTDEGLEEYDVGSREDVKAGKSENFGTDPIEVTRYGTPKIDGNAAMVDIEAIVGEPGFAAPVYLVTLEGVKHDGDWMLNGFEFKGGPPPGEDATVVDVKAIDYAFQLSGTTAPADEPLAFKFSNGGKEQHELTMFKAPGEVTLDEAKAVLENVDGSELEDIPDGYEAAHVSFVEVGQTQNVTFAEPLDAGTYVLACYIPQGGFGDEGPVNPDGKPHIQLGMINLLTVE